MWSQISITDEKQELDPDPDQQPWLYVYVRKLCSDVRFLCGWCGHNSPIDRTSAS
jgi:hypothetical protein